MKKNRSISSFIIVCFLLSMLGVLAVSNAFSRTSAFDDTTKFRSPVEIVNAYVNAANNRDLEGFLALYSPNIKKYQFPATLTSEGIDHMRKVYTKSFATKTNIHVEIRSLIALGDKVISYDHVTGLPGGDEADETVVYQIEKGLIATIVYLDRIIKPGNGKTQQ